MVQEESGEPSADRARSFDIIDTPKRERIEALRREGGQRAIAEYERLIDKLDVLAQSLGTARDLVTIFRALKDFAVASVPCIGIFIALYDPQRDVRTACYAWGDGEEVDVSKLPPMPIGDGPNSRAIRTGEIVITDDYLNAMRGRFTVSVGRNEGLLPQSSMAVPMAVMGRTVGNIEVQSYDLAAYGREHATAMRMAANLAANAIENVRLFERESRARAAAEESNRLKDEFLATLSHELRTPLTAVLGWTNLLRTRQLDEGNAARALEIIERNAKSQKQLIDDLLEVSHVITGKSRLDVRLVNLVPIIEAAVDVVRPAAATKGIQLMSRQGPVMSFVSGDPDRLQQAVWNLLSNAVKFTPGGGRVEVSLEHVDSEARVTVRDTGQGINPEFLPYVFDRFRQADSTTTRAHGGLGLGLAIVRHLIELHGGTVRAESPGEGQGAVFTISLPLAPGASEIERMHSTGHEGLASEPVPALKGLQVLVVDDEPDTCEFLSTVLKQHGAEVTSAASCEEALGVLERIWPDVLVSDIGMPGEDGYELIRRVRTLERARGWKLPAAALTAYAGVEDRTRALVAGFQMHLPKPVEPSELVATVASLAGRMGEH